MNNKLKVIQEKTPWYEKGLNFKCTGCGKCCSGAPGYIWVTPKEIEEIALFLKIPEDEFRSKYLVRIGDKYSIRDLKHLNYNCIFLRDKQCSIYPVRPSQCKTYPFWPSIMRSKETWDQEASACEGIRLDHPQIQKEKIEEKLKA